MPIEIRRFGVGHRRPHGPEGSSGVAGQPIHAGNEGVVAELAFRRAARIEPHSNPNLTWFVVIEGGGWVSVGEERARVAAGEAVLWPPGIDHSAWTDVSEMRAIVVELPIGPPAVGYLEAGALPVSAATGGPIERGEGSLREDDRPVPTYDPAEGEPR